VKDKLFLPKVIVVSFLFLFLAALTYAGTTGKISGVIKDKESGEPLPGVTVQIAGTSMGAATNEKGEYFIVNIPSGTYALKVSAIGYTPVEMRNVLVAVDLTTSADFSLTTQPVELAKGITVVAERPLLIKDKTATIKLVTGDEVANLPTKGYQGVVELQTGVVTHRDNPSTRLRGVREDTNLPTINIRGGRASETAYYVDGFSQQDYLTGISTTNINTNSIEQVEVVTGGFNAEYGRVMSGLINVTTKAGGSKYSGSGEAVTDNLMGEKDRYDYNLYDLSFSGPLAPQKPEYTFFVSGERRWFGDRSPHATANGMLPDNSLSGWTWQGKLDFKLTPALDLNLGTLGSKDDWREYQRIYHFDIAHTPRYVDENASFYARVTHSLSKSLFYTASGNYFLTDRKRGDGVYFDNLIAYGRPGGNPRYDGEALFWSWDDRDSITATRDTLIPNILNGGEAYPFVLNDESHVWDDYLHRKSSYYGFNFDLTAQVSQYHQLKSGLEFQRHTLRFYNHLFPTQVYNDSNLIGFQDVNNFGYNQIGEESDTSFNGLDGAKHPYTIAFYLQDKFEWRGMVLNAGMRFDYLNLQDKRLKSETLPFGTDSLGNKQSSLGPEDLEDAPPFTQVSPRVGLGFPVTDLTVLHFNYGKFFQQPDLQNLYVSYRYLEYKIKSGGYYFAFGNPNLKPEQTTAYELGLAHQLGENLKFDVTAFYKDVKNQTEVVNQPSYPRSFATFKNRDFGTIKGLEFALTMRRTRNVELNLNYTLSYAKGTGSYPNTQQNIAWAVGPNVVPPKLIAPLEFDQRHKLTAILDLRYGTGKGVLSRSGISFVLNAASGNPYSPIKMANEITLGNFAPTPDGSINSRYGPWTYGLDLKAEKRIPVGFFNLDFYVWILNVFDRENAVVVYTTNGSPNTTGWLATSEGQAFINNLNYNYAHDSSGLTAEEKYRLREQDPTNYDIPRQVRFGVRVNF
jgi:outer membrane receptor protein involved in Fe transport